jgi:hypothetical protein
MFMAQESQWEWEFNEYEEPIAFVQVPPSDFVQRTVPLRKCLLFRTTGVKNNPEGRSCLRNAYTSWYYRNRLQEIEAIGTERDLAGMPVLYIPMHFMTADASAAERSFYEDCKMVIRNIRRDEHEGVILPSNLWKDSSEAMVRLELLSTGGSRQIDSDKIITRYDQRIAGTMLADFVLLGHDKVGSFALSSDKTDMFALAVGAFLKDIAGVIRKQGSERLLAINGMQGRASLVPGDLEKPEVAATIEALNKLVTGGIIMPDPALEGWAREIIGAPKADGEFITADGEQEGVDDPAAGEEPEGTGPLQPQARGPAVPPSPGGQQRPGAGKRPGTKALNPPPLRQ